jgi:hypothetical protein
MLVTGPATASIGAAAGGPQTAAQGPRVALGAAGSLGQIDGHAWTAPDGVVLEGANTATPSLTVAALDPPASTRDLAFTLTVRGPAGTDTATVTFAWAQERAPGDPRARTSRLTVANVRGESNATTTAVTAASADAVTTGTVRYRDAERRRVVDGTAKLPAGNEVTVHAGPTLDGPVIGTATAASVGNGNRSTRGCGHGSHD